MLFTWVWSMAQQRLTTPMQHIRPPQPIRSGSGDLVMNPIRKSSSQSSDLEAMSRQVSLTRRHTHASGR